MRNDELNGKKIVTHGGRDLGEVVGQMLDVELWRVTGLRVRVLRERLDDLRLKRPLLGSPTITIPIEQVQAVSDRVVLRRTIDELTFIGGEQADAPKPTPAASDEDV